MNELDILLYKPYEHLSVNNVRKISFSIHLEGKATLDIWRCKEKPEDNENTLHTQMQLDSSRIVYINLIKKEDP